MRGFAVCGDGNGLCKGRIRVEKDSAEGFRYECCCQDKACEHQPS